MEFTFNFAPGSFLYRGHPIVAQTVIMPPDECRPRRTPTKTHSNHDHLPQAIASTGVVVVETGSRLGSRKRIRDEVEVRTIETQRHTEGGPVPPPARRRICSPSGPSPHPGAMHTTKSLESVSFRPLTRRSRSRLAKLARSERSRLHRVPPAEPLGRSTSSFKVAGPCRADGKKRWRDLSPSQLQRYHFVRTRAAEDERDSERESTPPGFWDTAMPDDETFAEYRRECQELERRKIEARYQMALNGVDWRFADETPES